MKVTRIDGKLELEFDGRYAHTCSKEEEKQLKDLLCEKKGK